MQKIQELVGKNLLFWIKKKEYLSVEAFCYQCGISKAVVSSLINGRRDLRLSSVQKLAVALEIPFHELFVERPELSGIRKGRVSEGKRGRPLRFLAKK